MRIIRTRQTTGFGHAVVIGGSVAGLMAARVLSEHFERVTLLERDAFPETADYRKGLPQAHHQHVLLARGRDVMERWFPGLDAELARRGAPHADYTRDFVLVSAVGRLPRFVSDIELRLCRRIHIDDVLVRQLRALPKVTVRERVSVTDYEFDAEHKRVTGVALGSGEILHADLVIDAGGRGSRTPKWLEKFGYTRPTEQVVDAHLGYATRIYEKPFADEADYRAVEVASVPPHNPRAAGLWEVEGNRWLLTLIGTAGQHPPTDEAGFMEFARNLSDPLVFETISRATPLTDIVPYSGTENRWRHYEKLATFPAGLIVLGDAFCAFNPIYGQGMTIAALEGEVLHAALRKARTGARLDHTVLRSVFYRRAQRLVSSAWLLATSEDLRWERTEGARTPLIRASLAYFELLMPLSVHSTELVKTFLEIANLKSSPLALARPTLLFQLARHWARHGLHALRGGRSKAKEVRPSATDVGLSTRPGTQKENAWTSP